MICKVNSGLVFEVQRNNRVRNSKINTNKSTFLKDSSSILNTCERFIVDLCAHSNVITQQYIVNVMLHKVLACEYVLKLTR